jgi:hypothetical protein
MPQISSCAVRPFAYARGGGGQAPEPEDHLTSMKTPPETGQRKSLIFQEWIKITGSMDSLAPFGQNLPVQTDL